MGGKGHGWDGRGMSGGGLCGCGEGGVCGNVWGKCGWDGCHKLCDGGVL